ncbi:DUF2145 domain-containing protein [Vampirovibrio sp.]|uniref:DUF2145 domain-containing protein n=1 Tax=Vampirovibrio sp. TaxID=2717857 RepID=UPI0035930780
MPLFPARPQRLSPVFKPAVLDQFVPRSRTRASQLQLTTQASATLPPSNTRKAEHYLLFFPSLYPREWARVCPAPRKAGMDPPFEMLDKKDSRKLEMAQKLADWTLSEMKAANAGVAIIARGGSHISKTQDRTWMEHSGILMYNRKSKEWEVYNLLNDFCDQAPRCEIWRHKPLDFYYSQPNYDEDAMLLLPDANVRKKLRKAIESGAYKQLQFTNAYNLITRFDGQKSLNCNKWVLMNVVAARMDNYKPEAVLAEIGNTFAPGEVKVCSVIRPLAKQHPTILQTEAPLSGPINTVTAESLYRSDLFEKKLFYDPKTLKRLTG